MQEKSKQTILMILIALASPIGIVISVLLAIIKIDYKQILNIKITNIESVSTIMNIFQPWYKWSFVCLLISLAIVICFGILKYTIFKKHQQKDELNLFVSFTISVIIILLAQIVLPLMSVILILAFAILYGFLGISFIFQYMLRIIVQVFGWILQDLFIAIGIDIELGNFIGQEYVSIFLTLIIFLILIPYLFSGVLCIVKRFFSKITRANAIIDIAFKPIEFIFKLIHIRYFIYIILFLLSILTYSYNVNNSTNWLTLIKESLLAFVLLDTICYSLYENHCKKKKLRLSKIYLNLIIPYKLDLEYIRSIMTTYALKNNHMGKAKIIFSNDISVLSLKKNFPFNNIILEIQSLNGSLMTYEALYIKINEVLFCIYKYESGI